MALRRSATVPSGLRSVKVVKTSDRKLEERHSAPPLDLMANIIAQPRWPFPTLAAIAEIPFMRPDGSTCLEPGYDCRRHD